MSTKINKLAIGTFLISPILSLPLVVQLIAMRQNYAYYLLSVIIGLVVYMYEPTLSVDLSRYYLAYKQIAGFTTWSELSVFLEGYPDSFLYVSSYLLSRVGLGFQFYVLLMTIFNTSLIFSIYRDLIKDYELTKARNLTLFTFFIIIVGLASIIGVSRQFTAFSIILYCYYFGIWKGKRTLDLFILVSVVVHFSSIGLIAVYYAAKYFVPKTKVIKSIFYISFLMYVIPSGYLNTIISNNVLSNSIISESVVLSKKVDSYALSGNDERIKVGASTITTYGKIGLLLKSTIPFVLVVAFSLFSNIKFDNFYYLLFAIVNITNSLISIHGRYLHFTMMIFAIFFIKDILLKKRLGGMKHFFIAYIMFKSIFFFVFSYGDRILKVIIDPHMLSSITIFLKDVNYDMLTW